MRVLYISYDGALEPLGQSQIIAYLKGLSLSSGTEFTLITFEKERYARDKNACKKVFSDLARHNINWVKLTYHKNPYVLSTFFDICLGMFFAVRAMMSKKHDLLHARAYVPALMCFFLKKMFGTKFIFDMRGFWADERADAGIWKKGGMLYKLVKFFEKKFLYSSDVVVILTAKSSGHISGFIRPGTGISVIPCAADLNRFKFYPGASLKMRRRYGLQDKFIFLHAGSLEGWYLVDKMVDFFKIAKKNMSNAHFFILTHSKPDRLLKLIDAKGLNREDFTLEEAAYSDMPFYISAADAGLFFLMPTFSMQATSPTKVAEYLGCGLPIVANTGIGDIEDYVLEGVSGSLVRDFSKNSFDAALAGILNVSKNINTKQQCRKIAQKNLSLDAALSEYTNLYELFI
ncbi:MAG: hypothetical protein AUJ89_06330 [Candidatus Omnitrophica bacterium CG1_02_43_210]|nr:MAG: hypothetical protein AUJ89_06330 [Candidatus Omnitrophica bacterium CG1_02_43_210]PIV39309.1 MAG: hypothetical protein COS29_03350 [Candidatus Omnitrophica bacterium CG02_land_8_20_14_3_00__42_8]